MNFLKKWLIAARIESTLLSVLSIGLGSALAAFSGTLNKGVCVLATLTAVLLQIICNLANDCGDLVHGADHINTIKPSSALKSGLVSLSEVKQVMLALIVLTIVSGIWLLYQANLSVLEYSYFILLGITAITAAVDYTLGDQPYGYRGWGDIAVFVFFGVVGVGGTFYLHTHQVSSFWLLPAVSYGSLTVAVLNLNNMRDYDTDMQVGKRTLPVRYGLAWAIGYHRCLLISTLASAIAFTLMYYQSPWQWLFMVVTPPLLRSGYTVGNATAEQLNTHLQGMIKTTVVFTILFSAGLIAAIR